MNETLRVNLPNVGIEHKHGWKNEGYGSGHDREKLVDFEVTLIRMFQNHLKMFMCGVDSSDDWQETNDEANDPTDADMEQSTAFGHLGLDNNIIYFGVRVLTHNSPYMTEDETLWPCICRG